MAKEVLVEQPVQPPVENVTTLTNIITQSLKSGDSQLMETALGVTDPVVIQATLVKVPSDQIPSFLDALVQRLTMRPGRLQHLLPWLRGCIFVHGPAMMSNPSSRASLDALQALIDRRLASHDDLLKLSGRLDLVMLQILGRSSAGEDADKVAAMVNKPLAVYQADEDDESEGEEMQALPESDVSSSEEEDTNDSDNMSVDEE